jgi:glycosyltransferase involved in cell wall biosynthesis
VFELKTTGAHPIRVLIAGINYAPEESGNAPYTTGLAEHLAESGHNVSVLTGMPYYPQWKIPVEYRRKMRASEERNGVKVHRLRTYVPRKQDAVRRIAFEGGFFVNGALTRQVDPPDVVIGVVPTLSGAGLAATLAHRHRVPYGLIFQDLVGAAAQQSGIRGGKRVAKVTRDLEGRLARSAGRIAVISPGFIAYLEQVGVPRDRLVHIRNWSHLPQPTAVSDDVRARLGWSPDDIVVLHAGAMGLKQGLENVVDTARLAASALPSARIVFMGDGNQKTALVERAGSLPNIDFIPPCDKADLPDILAAANILLVNERASVSDMSLPSKLTSYLVAGRPIVAAVPLEGYTAREIDASEAGLVVPPEDPAALLYAISSLAGDPGRSRQLGEAGVRYVESTLRPGAILPQLSAFVGDLLVPDGVRSTNLERAMEKS